MLADISKTTTLYLAPVLMLAALFLILFAYLAPVVMLHGQVSLLTVVSSSVLTQPGSNEAVDGPSMFLGMLGRSESLVLGWTIRHSCSHRVLHQAKQCGKFDLHIGLDYAALQCVFFITCVASTNVDLIR